ADAYVSGRAARESAAARRPTPPPGPAPARRAELASAFQPGAPRGPHVGVAVVQLAEPDVGHPLAGLPGARLVEVGAGLPLRAPDPAKHFQGLIGLAAHPLLLPGGTVNPA